MQYIFLLLIGVFLFPMTGQAQLPANEQVLINNIPYLSDKIADGMELRYLGRDAGMDGWIAELDGQIELFYSTPDGDGVVLGVLFDENGENITRDQMADIDDLNPVDTSGLNPSSDQGDRADRTMANTTDRGQVNQANPNSPGERLFAAVTDKRHFSIGSARAPEMYLIVDPTCPYCKTLWSDLADPYIKSGQVLANIIPVGALGQTASDITARILGADDPSEAWLNYISDGPSAIVANPMDTGYQQHFDSVMTMMENWEMTTVPYTVYRADNGAVKLVRGVPKDMQSVVDDLRGDG